jgi:hypothetical protein
MKPGRLFASRKKTSIGYCPVPDREAVCGLPPPSSATETLAVRSPVAVGVKVTLIVQLVNLGRLLPQVPGGAREKSEALVPTMVITIEFSVRLPTLVRVMFCGVLEVPTVTVPNPKLVGVSLAIVPVPVREIVCGLFHALSVIVTVSVIRPLVFGRNDTVIVQVLPAGRLVPQVWFKMKLGPGGMIVKVSV